MKPLLLALMLVAPAALAPFDEAPLALGGYGTAFLEARSKAAKDGKIGKAADLPIEDLFAKHCVHAALGTFEIAYPVWHVDEKRHVEDLQTIASTLVNLQVHWMDWLAKGDERTTPARTDADTLLAWIKTWKPASISRAETAADKDLFALLDATDAQKAAARRLGEFIGKTEVLGVAPRDGRVTRILFAPTRRDFAELLGYAGLRDPQMQPTLWTKQATTWTSFWIDWTFVMALEYPPWTEDKEFKTGLSMNKFEATGMLQHTVQQAMQTFLWMVYGDSDAIYLNQAQAMAMAIELCGEINALEGEGGRGTTGAHTDPYEKFVPGGNPTGGVLPPIPAAPFDTMKENPWHEGLGRDYFAAPLRKGQRLGAKNVAKDGPKGLDPLVLRDKRPHFQITSRDETRHYVVSAPFMGSVAKIRAYPPPEFVVDFREFFRAYKCGFYHWLQTQGDKAGPEASAAKYRSLLKSIGTRSEEKTLDALVQELYGVPLSARNGESDSLEWRFLDWLAKGK